MGDTKDKETKDALPSSSSFQEEPSTSKESGSEKAKDAPPKQRAEAEDEQEEDDEEISLGAAVAGLSSWFTSFTSSAKEKSTEYFQYLKQDFNEFTEASKDFKDKLKLEDTAKSAVQVVQSKAGIVLEQMSTIFGVGPDDDDEAIVLSSSDTAVVDRVKGKLYTMSVDEEVFLKDPVDIKAYANWILQFDLDEKESEMSDIMTGNPHLQLRYAQLVPQKVSHLVLWHRFYYHVHSLARQENLAKKSTAENKEAGSSDAGMRRGDDDSPTGSEFLSEDEQSRILAEYEEEMKNSSAQHSRKSSGTQLSSSSSGSFVMIHDAATDEVKVE